MGNTRKQAADFAWELGENAVKAGATGAMLAITGMAQNILAWDWVTVGGYAGSAAAISILFSLGAKNVGEKNSAQYIPPGWKATGGNHVAK